MRRQSNYRKLDSLDTAAVLLQTSHIVLEPTSVSILLLDNLAAVQLCVRKTRHVQALGEFREEADSSHTY